MSSLSWSSKRRRSSSLRDHHQKHHPPVPSIPFHPHQHPDVTTTPHSLLLQLSTSCQHHKDSCHPGTTEECATRWNLVPAPCQAALTSLERILPSVEAAATSSGTGPAQTTQQKQHLAHLYSNLLDGGFCPHAPHVLVTACGRETTATTGNGARKLEEMIKG